MRYTTPDSLVHLTEQDRTQLRQLITDHSGLDSSAQADNALERAVAQRLAAYELASLADYWPVLRSSSGSRELNSLVQLLTNKETFFFREMHQFELLRDQLLPDLLSRSQLPLQVWSAGCATGEEPYSLAITLLEYQRQHGEFQVQVIGTDIDTGALEKARRGVYGERAVRLVRPELRQRYFSFDGQAYRINPQVGRLVRFQTHNLAEDACPASLVNLDIVFCRNITIYFDDRARDRLNARLADCLLPGGYLFVASAETMSHNLGRLELISVGNTFLFQKALTPRSSLLSGSQPLAQGSAPDGARGQAREQPSTSRGIQQRGMKVDNEKPANRRREGSPGRAAHPEPDADRQAQAQPPSPLLPSSSLRRAVEAFQRQDYQAALRRLDRIPVNGSIWLDVYCLRSAVLLQQERLGEAETNCQTLLAHDPWHADAHFMMGLIFRQQNEIEAAVRSFRTAIYLHPEHRHAHFYLAEIYHALGLQELARREYKNTLNILLHLASRTETLNLAGIEDDILRRACEANLRKLEGRTHSSGRNST
jgi:chemotaxis protein methyltransferase CheR